ncbi:MAG: ABC transporter ATP-binding protein, partial [Alphaproteobacteria bacterium]|nr:ABC transporter ATP-binding protein [Alphaproteobacteria bacterium]
MASSGTSRSLLEVRNLKVALPAHADRPFAVNDISFDIGESEILCIVGESGSGKSLTAAAIMRLLPRSVSIAGGSIHLDGTDLLALSRTEMRELRGRRISMIFQEPMTALNPLMRVGRQIEEILEAHTDLDQRRRTERVLELMHAVELPEPEQLRHAYPFRLSGGQRQRVMIAMALALDPVLLIADEPTTALDVTTQKQILALIKRIQSRMGMGVLFITHDFGVVAEIADRVVVMRHGQLVESGHVVDVLHRPQHPYTRTLIAGLRRERDARDRSVLTPAQPILQVRSVSKLFRRGVGLFRRGRSICAVDAAELVLHRGETLGLVGESGSGKSTLARCVVRLLDVTEGSIRFRETELATLAESEMRKVRSGIQMIFQDPYASLNPRQRVLDIIADGPAAHGVDR